MPRSSACMSACNERATVVASFMRSHVEVPPQLVGVAPRRLALDDEGVAADRQLIAGMRGRNLARPYLESRGLGVDAGVAEPTIVSGRLAITRTDTGSPPAGV
jgi:hypothetical protein